MTGPATAWPLLLAPQRPRAARCHLVLLQTPDEFARLGIALVVVADGIDTTTRDTERALAAALLRAERAVRSERSSVALADASSTVTKSGRPPGRLRLQIDRDQIRVLRDEGRSLAKIAERLGVSIGLVRHECARHRQAKEPATAATVAVVQEGV